MPIISIEGHDYQLEFIIELELEFIIEGHAYQLEF